MRTCTHPRKALGILGVLICVGFLAVIVMGLTVSLAGLALSSSRYAESVRARALAEAGLEAAFAKLLSSPDTRINPFSFELDGGRCSVDVRRTDKEPDRLEIVSAGEPRLAGGRMNSRITLSVRVTGTGGRKTIHVLRRTEETRYVRAEPAVR